MPIVTIPKATGVTAASNHNLATLLGSEAPAAGWVTGLILQSPSTNTEDIKVGDFAMTSTNYDAIFSPGDSDDDSPSEARVMLNTRYVRSDGATDQSLIIRFEST